MLDKVTAVAEVMRRLRKMEAGDSLELLTWKKNRSLLLAKQSENEVVIYEREGLPRGILLRRNTLSI